MNEDIKFGLMYMTFAVLTVLFLVVSVKFIETKAEKYVFEQKVEVLNEFGAELNENTISKLLEEK